MELKIIGNNFYSIKHPAITLGEKMAYLNKPLVNKLEINNDSHCLFSVDTETGDIYFCVLPLVSNLKGYKATSSNASGGGVSITLLSARARFDLPYGHFDLSDPIFKDPIDWYKLEKRD